jgi:hypothetical protein
MLTYVVYILTGIVIGLLLMLISSSMLKGLICILFAVPSVYIIYSYKKQNSLLKTCIHNLELNICGEHFLTDAYMDTGNGLVDLSGQNVMITDCTYALELLGSRYVTLLDTYHLKKSFDYAKANSISDIFFRPVPYRTVCSNFCIMPGFTADSVLHKETGKIYQNITIAISPNRLLLPMDAKLLSNRYLKF